VLSLVLFWYLKAHRKEVAFLYAAAAAIFLIFSFTIHVTRITGVADYGSSVSYRLELQNITLRQVQSVPLLGVGVGNIEHVIPCQKLLSVLELRKTCADGFIFSSSHNIFLDRILQFGLLAGLLYLAIFGMTILRALHAKLTAELVVMLLLELSICLYFLSNVSLPEIELLLFTLNCNLLVRTI
jgi:O-antigen ligase